MFQRTKISTGLLLAFGVSVLATMPALAQETQRVEITGSSIKRVDAETALPVTVYKRDDIERTGAATVEDLIANISVNNGGGYQTSGALGDSARPGFAGASMRALGSANTLVLLNGRRLAVYAFDGGAVSLNDIPLAAVDRIEILRDGASSTYGTDAIAGVINLITRNDFQSGQISLAYSRPQQKGGSEKSGTITVGYGDLGSDKFNVMGIFTHTDLEAVKAKDRSFSKTAFRLADLGINRLSSNAFPANVATPGLASPGANFYGGNCLPPTSFGTSATDKRCRFDYASVIDIIPESKRDALFLKGTAALGNINLGAEYAITKNVYTFRISPTPASEATTLNGDPVLVSTASKYYPTAWVAANFPSLVGKDLNIYWRSVDAGPRTNMVHSDLDRAVLTANGTVGAWDFDLGLMRSTSKARESYTNGYLYEDKLLRTGGLMPTDAGYSAAVQTIDPNINPFGPNDAAGLAAIQALKVIADTRISKSTRTSFDGKISNGSLAKLGGGSLGVAVGFEARRETFSDDPLAILNSGDIIGGAGTQLPVDASRHVEAVFAELSAPLLKDLELSASIREDKYSDFGSTTNPKLAASWKMMPNAMVRASIGTGFRAPTLPDLFQPLQKGNTNGVFNDPFYLVSVPGGCDNVATADGRYCGAQLNKKSGGNPDLKPEKSNQYAFGLVFDATKEMSFTVDYFDVMQKGLIGIVLADTKLTDYIKNGASSKYVGDIYTKVDSAGHTVIDYVLENYANLGKQNTRGLDFSAKFRFPNFALGKAQVNFDGSYLISQRQQDPDTGVWTDNLVGKYATFGGAIQLKHRTEFILDNAGWEGSLAYNWQSGYQDYTPNRTVGAYETFDLGVTYKGIKNLKLAALVRNVMNRNPPDSNQNDYFQVGYDPANTNPKGRTFGVGLEYKFW